MKKILYGIAAFLTLLAGGFGANQLGSRLNPNEIVWMNELAATTTASNIVVSNVVDYKIVGVTVASTATTGTLKVACSRQGSLGVQPTFTSAASATNRWDYVQIVDQENGASTDGDTGIAMTNETSVRQFEIDADLFKWCTVMMSPWTSGTTTVTMLPATNF